MSDETDVTVGRITPLTMAQEALHNPEIDADKLDKLLAVQERFQEGEARRAYTRSVAAFQAECPIVEKGDKAYDSAYAALDRIWRTIRPLMGKHGLFVQWEECAVREGIAYVLGHLGHADGHMIDIKQAVPIPQKGSANDAQKVGSATTYAKRYCLMSALNIVTGEDDDGSAVGTGAITDSQVSVLHAAIELCADPEAVLAKTLAYGGVDDLCDYPAAMYAVALRAVRNKQGGKA